MKKSLNHRQKGNGLTNDGASVVEYIVLMMIIIGSFFVMRYVISHGIFARHKAAGESFGFGRQYDPRRSTVCKQDPDVKIFDNVSGNDIPFFYDEECFYAQVSYRPNKWVAGSDPNPGYWDSDKGCPQCYPGDESCFICEDKIKRKCTTTDYCNNK